MTEASAWEPFHVMPGTVSARTHGAASSARSYRLSFGTSTFGSSREVKYLSW